MTQSGRCRCWRYGRSGTFAGHGPFSVGVTTRLSALPTWKHQAEFLDAQASFDLEALLRWRYSVRLDGPVLAGVLVVTSVAMAKTLSDATSQIDLSASLLERLETGPDTDADVACSLMEDIKASTRTPTWHADLRHIETLFPPDSLLAFGPAPHWSISLSAVDTADALSEDT